MKYDLKTRLLANVIQSCQQEPVRMKIPVPNLPGLVWVLAKCTLGLVALGLLAFGAIQS